MISIQRMGKGERITGGLLIVLFVAAMWITSSGKKVGGTPRSVDSYQSDGRALAYKVLEGVQFDVDSWMQAPQFLPNSGGVLFMPGVPVENFGRPPGEELDPHQRPRNAELYGEFVRAGGALVLPYTEENVAWLRESCSLVVPDWAPTDEFGSFDVTLDTGESLTLNAFSTVTETGDDEEEEDSAESDEAEGEEEHDLVAEEWELDPDAAWTDFAMGAEDRPFISWSAQGYGRVVLLAGDRWLENDILQEAQNALLLVRLVEAMQTTGPVLFDEFALGRWVPQTKFEVMISPAMRAATVQLLLVCLIFVLLYAWVREFPRDPERPRLDPRLRAQAQVAWLERAGRFDLLADDLQQGVLARLQARLGLRAADRRLPVGQRLQQDLDSIEVHLPTQLAKSPWRGLFSPSAVQNKRELEQLGRDLRHLERTVLDARIHRTKSMSKSS
jgi:hypothetical protein